MLSRRRKDAGFGYYLQILAYVLKIDKAYREASTCLGEGVEISRELRNRIKVWHYLTYWPWETIRHKMTLWRIRQLEDKLRSMGKLNA